MQAPRLGDKAQKIQPQPLKECNMRRICGQGVGRARRRPLVPKNCGVRQRRPDLNGVRPDLGLTVSKQKIRQAP